MEYLIKSEEEMISLGSKIASSLKPFDVIAMRGNLGVGKTFLTRAIIRSFLAKDTVVSSPTFNILQIYDLKDYSIYHYDLYRLKSSHEIYELAIEDAFNGNITIIEWPEIIDNILPKSKIDINIICNENGERMVNISQ